MKWSDSFKCPECGLCHCTVVSGRRLPLYQCPKCRHQTSATAGTILANTKLTLVKWFLPLYFVATNKDSISGMVLAKYISITLKTAWVLLHKSRSAMGERESLYRRGGSVEMDEAFFGGKAAGKRAGAAKTKWFLEDINALDWMIDISESSTNLSEIILRKFVEIYEINNDSTTKRISEAQKNYTT